MLKTGAVLEARRARLLFCTRVMAKRAMMTAAAMAIPEKDPTSSESGEIILIASRKVFQLTDSKTSTIAPSVAGGVPKLISIASISLQQHVESDYTRVRSPILLYRYGVQRLLQV